MNAVIELEEAYNHYKDDPEFNRELTELLNDYAGRPSRLYYAARMTKDLGGAKIYLKREDLNHTGAHKINNVLGQVLLAKKMGKTRVIAETGAGQHGVATATAAALMDMECEIFMGKEDTERQALNVYRMRLLGAQVHAVTSGTATLKDAVSETMREWTNRISDTHYAVSYTHLAESCTQTATRRWKYLGPCGAPAAIATCWRVPARPRAGADIPFWAVIPRWS